MRRLSVFIAAMGALIGGSCTHYIDSDVPPVACGHELDFHVSFDDRQSRVLLSEEMRYEWEGCEQVGVYASEHSEIANSPYNINLDKESGLASFTLSSSVPITEGRVMAYMPYSATNDSRGGNDVVMSIPMSQTQSVGGVFNVANMPMVSCCDVVGGGSTPQAMYFRPIGAFLAVNIYSSNRSCVGEKVRYVTFNSDSSAVAGAFDVDLTAGREDLQVKGTSKSVLVKMEEPFLVTKDNDGANPVYMVVAPGTHEGVLSVHTNKGVYEFEYGPEEFARNTYRAVNINIRTSKRKKSAPAPADNNIVAHRGGSKEAGVSSHPDNSLAAMRYAQSLGCMASEMDIYCTKDNRVIVYHANSKGLINGLCPYLHTLEELRLAGKLANGEDIPTLEELFEVAMVPGSCTKIHFDPKLLQTETTIYREASIKVCELACDIIYDYGAENWVEFLMIGDAAVTSEVHKKIKSYGINVAWTKNGKPADLKAKGYSDWLSVSCKNAMNADWGGGGSNDLQDYIDAGMKVSVYCVDKVAGYTHAVYEEAYVQKYIENIDKFYSIVTNYPKWLLQQRLGKSRDYYVYGGPVGRGDSELVTEGIALEQTAIEGVYSCRGYFHNTEAVSGIRINTDNIATTYPCYALAEDGRLVRVASDAEVPAAPEFDIDGMRTLTVNLNDMTYEFERISTFNALPDDHLSYYDVVDITANGRTKRWMARSLDWDGGKNARTLKLGTRPAAGSATGGYGSLSSLHTERNAAYDEVESGGSVEGSAEHAAAGGRLYTLSEILTGVPSAGVDLMHKLTDWPVAYRKNTLVTDATGRTMNIVGVNASTITSNTTSPLLYMQLQGICPYGWHVANAQDVYDMLCAATEAKGGTVLPYVEMLGTWSVADVLRSATGWNDTPQRHAKADALGINLYPSGVRTYADGFSSLGESASMFVCMPGGLFSSKDGSKGVTISGVNTCWAISSLGATGESLTISDDHTVGTAAMSLRCVKNY
ncbi:MAG: hypothetical protein IJ348_03170 [Alistipes sp.]|nr:hypothetical protein [Alistipes sp.]